MGSLEDRPRPAAVWGQSIRKPRVTLLSYRRTVAERVGGHGGSGLHSEEISAPGLCSRNPCPASPLNCLCREGPAWIGQGSRPLCGHDSLSRHLDKAWGTEAEQDGGHRPGRGVWKSRTQSLRGQELRGGPAPSRMHLVPSVHDRPSISKSRNICWAPALDRRRPKHRPC